MIMPGIFMGLVALISVILIYQSNEQIIKTQKKYRKELEEFNKSIIGAFTNCIDGKDAYTNGHSYRVALYTTMLANKLGVKDQETLDKYYNIGLLHDIGKISIPDAILTKPGKLTPEEFDTIKSHAKRGYEILKDVKIQDDIAAGAHYHHERYDGKGYPDGLSDTQIPQIARIISVADAFDAMSSTRHIVQSFHWTL
ncbi:HD-GYP domain-containing protein [Treponema sp.]|uniref:HD-GYP domain-containing protein n=1 Tax=Treponema sp. TaxID=166 RepID=UPI003890C771